MRFQVMWTTVGVFLELFRSSERTSQNALHNSNGYQNGDVTTRRFASSFLLNIVFSCECCKSNMIQNDAV